MLGFLAAEPGSVHVPLLGPAPNGGTRPGAAFVERARSLFREQVEKAGLPLEFVAEANLEVSKSALGEPEWLNGRQRPARELAFVVRAVTDLGREYKGVRVERVAPHDPSVEACSARASVLGGV